MELRNYDVVASYFLKIIRDRAVGGNSTLEQYVNASLAANWPRAAEDAVERALKPRGAKQKPWVWS